MSAQTSASERMEAARKALAAYDTYPMGGLSLKDAGRACIDALRSLIEPPAVGNEDLVRDFRRRITEQGSIAVLGEHAVLAGEHEPVIAGYRLGLRDGEQYAHERWEPADVPSQEFMLRHLGIDSRPARDGDTIIYVPAQYIEKES